MSPQHAQLQLHPRQRDSPTHHRRLSRGAGKLSHSISTSGYQRRLSKDQPQTSSFPGLAGSLIRPGSSSVQGHHHRLNSGGERPTLPPLSLSAQQSHPHPHPVVPITITAPTPASATSKRVPSPTFALNLNLNLLNLGFGFGTSSRSRERPEARPTDAEEAV
jgi:hypothetical protein